MSEPAGASRCHAVPRRAHQARSFRAALGLTVLGTLLPGTAFLAAGRRKLGAATLVVFALCVGAGVWLATAGRHTALRLAVSTDSLLWLIVAVSVLAALWVAVVVLGYRMLAPGRTTGLQHALGAFVVLVLAAVVALPAYEATHLAAIQRGLIAELFHEHQRSATVVDKPNPFAGKPRVNVLLLGGDSGPGREGVRTDTVIVASIDTKTGKTVLFSLPRNLENLPFPPGSPLAKAYPHGFADRSEDESLLNAVYDNGPAAHPNILGSTDHPGGDFLKLGVGQALGLHIDYFVLVNMEAFSRLVDALGGITVNSNYWVPVGGEPTLGILPDDYIAPGRNIHMDGPTALAWARGRFGLSDYLRMDRQRCALQAIADAADPVTVLRQYQKLAATTQDMVVTDIPQQALDDFVDLGLKIKDASIRSVVFDNHVIDPAYPDYDTMRQIVQQALAPAGTTDDSPRATSSAAPSSGAPSPGAAPSGATSPVSDLKNACAYDPAQAQQQLAQGKPPTKHHP